MKKVFLGICAIALFAYTANAQFHIELGSKYSLPQGDFADSDNGRIGFSVEPKYAMTENIDLGLYIGSNAFASADYGEPFTGATATLVILPTAIYRFSTNTVTPYAGLGIGLYKFKRDEVSSILRGLFVLTNRPIVGDSESKFGFAPRAGVYIGRLNLGAAYNIVSDANYIQINLGVRILSRD